MQQQTQIPGLQIPHFINGDTVIAFTNQRALQTQNWFDAPKVSTYLSDPSGKSHTKYLGMINLMATTHNQPLPLMHDLFKNSAVLEIEEGQSITYDVPVTKVGNYCHTAEDTSDEQDYPGIDETVFRIVLSKKFEKGEIITYDMKNGVQAMVSNAHTPEMVGENWAHWLQLSANSKADYFPKEYLKPGIQYWKVTQVTGELETEFGGVSSMSNPSGTLTCEFTLGDPRTVESFMTSKAANMSAPGLSHLVKGSYDRMAQNAEMFGKGNDMFFMSKMTRGADGMYNGINQNSLKIGTTLEYLGIQELLTMEAHALTFAKAGTWRSGNGTKTVNEGIWEQLRRGKIITYARPGGITFDHLREAAAYIYKNSTIPIHEREIKFRGGYMAMQNIDQLFREMNVQQLNNLPSRMIGQDAQIQPVFTGPLGALVMERIQFAGGFVPFIGKVTIEHDATLDFDHFADRNSVGFHGDSGFADSSYSLTIWDAMAPGVSNVNDKVKNASLVEGGNSNANIYYIKHKDQPSIIYGYEQGRMADDSKFEKVCSSLKVMGKSFWGVSNSAALMLDCSRYITIELQRTVNK